MRFIGSHPYGHPEWTLLPTWDGALVGDRMESLSFFAGGSFILGGMVTDNSTFIDYGLAIADAAGAIYNMTIIGLGGEFVTWYVDCDEAAGRPCDPSKSIQIADRKFRLRPEVLETWYCAYRATKDPKYREWTWSAFEAINRYCRTDSGFSTIADVEASDGGRKLDVQESFVFAEVLKYVYLTQWEVSLPQVAAFCYHTDSIFRIRTCHSMSRTAGQASRIRGCTTPRHILSSLPAHRPERL